MKNNLTLIAFTLFTAVLFGQRFPSASDTEETVRNSGTRFPDRNVSEAAEAIAVITSGIRSRDNSSQNKAHVHTEADFQTYIRKADEFFAARKFSDAKEVYMVALTIKSDPYARDKILEAEALAEKQKRDREADEKEQMIREKAVEHWHIARAKAEQQVSDAKSETAKERFSGFYRVQMTGGVVGDHYESHGISTVMELNDPFSNYLKTGQYDTLSKFIVTANHQTLDGIVIPAGFHIIVYSEPGFNGAVLLDATGPAIVNNFIWKNDKRYVPCNTEDYKPELQELYPQAVRQWSETNMHNWATGSMKVMMEE